MKRTLSLAVLLAVVLTLALAGAALAETGIF